MANRAVRQMVGLAAWALATVALACPAAAGPNDLVLVITNEDYRGGVPKVEFARRDGEAFMKAMRELAGVPASRIIHIGGQFGASRGDFQDYFGADNRRLADLAAAIRPDTNVYLFYSGHGLAGTYPATGEAALFLVPVDGDTASPADRGNALPDIEAALSGMLAKRGSSGRVFLFLDTCFGGTSAGGAVAKDTRMVGDVVESVKAKAAPRVVRFAAATGKQLARWDTAEKHGLFTDALIEALYALQRGGQKAASASAIQALIDAQVERRLAQLFPGQSLLQTPSLIGDQSAVVVSFSGTGLVRDLDRQRTEATRCRTLAHGDDPAEIRAFLAACRTCTEACRATLTKQAASFEAVASACRAEGAEFARLVKRGAAAKAALAALAKEAECEAVRRDAGAALARLDADTQQARAKEEAERRAREAEADRQRLEALAAEAAKRDPAFSIVPGSGKSFRDKLANGTDCTFCPEMVVVPAGAFDMGTTEYDSEKPVRRVTIRQPFAVGKFEVTFAEWDACHQAGGCAHRPGDQGWGRGRRPVINVSWDDARQYVAWLSKTTGKGYRILTEAEWEYAARAGTTTRYHFGNSDSALGEHAWYSGNSGNKTQPVGGKAANAWGLHDMHGNVWEWVEDCWHDNYQGAPTDGSARSSGSCVSRVLRGGSWRDADPLNLRAALRGRYRPGDRNSRLGLRVARTLNP